MKCNNEGVETKNEIDYRKRGRGNGPQVGARGRSGLGITAESGERSGDDEWPGGGRIRDTTRNLAEAN